MHLREACADATLIGLDTGFFAHCLTGTTRPAEAARSTASTSATCATARRSCSTASTPSSISRRSRTIRSATVYEDVTLDINHARGRARRAAKAAGAGRFVFASSCSVYGVADDGPRTEESDDQPADRLRALEVLAEHGLAELADDELHRHLAFALRPRAG